MRRAPIDPTTTLVDVDCDGRARSTTNTIAIVGSAGNYGYGTIDPIAELAALALERGVGLHVDGCLGGFILPFGEQLGYDIPPFDFRVPGVTTISADTHKYGYGFKGTSLLMFRDRALRNSQYFFMTDWTGGKYCSPGIDGSRSSGLLAATWAAWCRSAARATSKYAKADLRHRRPRCRTPCERTPSCASSASRRSASRSRPTSSTSTTSTTRCGRAAGGMNGLQYPNAIHMAVTRPQTQPGVVEAWIDDLAAAVGPRQGEGRARRHERRDLRRHPRRLDAPRPTSSSTP